MKEILQKESPVLRQIAAVVPENELTGDIVKKVIKDMSAAMHSQKDGVAIAAPQIGVPIRIFVISGTLLAQADEKFRGDGSDLVFINPEIIKVSKEKKVVEEGCLSVRWLYGKLPRSVRVTMRAFNEKGQKIERGASGLLAQIFQHEVDHLNGILFTDNAKEVWEMSEEEIKEMQAKM